jgi:hypothetical protein
MKTDQRIDLISRVAGNIASGMGGHQGFVWGEDIVIKESVGMAIRIVNEVEKREREKQDQ